MTPEARERLISSLEKSYRDVVGWIDGMMRRGAIDLCPDGEWSTRQIIHHLADTEVARGFRLRLLLSAESPVLQAYDEKAFSDSLHYERPIEVSLALFKASTEWNIEQIRLVAGDDWMRSGVHEELGAFSVEDWLGRAVWHLEDHANQLRGLVEMARRLP